MRTPCGRRKPDATGKDRSGVQTHMRPGHRTGPHVVELRILAWPDSWKRIQLFGENPGVGGWDLGEMQTRRWNSPAGKAVTGLAHESPQVCTRRCGWTAATQRWRAPRDMGRATARRKSILAALALA